MNKTQSPLNNSVASLLRLVLPVLLVLLLSSAMLSMAGCGYNTKPVYDTQYRTVYVPIFKNNTFYQGMEFDVTKALINQIESRTPYKSSSSPNADTTLEGTIVGVYQGVISRERETGLPQDMEFRITVDVVWKQSMTNKIIRERKGLQVTGRYQPTQVIGDTYFRGQHAAAQRIADEVTAVMRKDW